MLCYMITLFPKIFSQHILTNTVNWSEYIESLARRGEILLGFDGIDKWDKEPEKTNKDKPGGPFYHPDTFVLMPGYPKVYFHSPY